MPDLEKYARDIVNAEAAVESAQLERSRGGRLDAVNRAQNNLANAHARYRECSGGNIPDRRGAKCKPSLAESVTVGTESDGVRTA